MDIATYLENKKKNVPERRMRVLCVTCMQPQASCYCAEIHRFNPGVEFVILIHRLEVRRRIATGRMSHLCLENSRLIMGQDYSDNEEVNAILADPNVNPMILYPGLRSKNLSTADTSERAEIVKPGRRNVIFVIDGTWATSRKMMRLSDNLRNLPRICFTPPGPSNFRVRKQPAAHCYSTIEAIHHTIELLSPAIEGYDHQAKPHGALIHAFNHMVEQQLEYLKQPKRIRRRSKPRRRISPAPPIQP